MIDFSVVKFVLPLPASVPGTLVAGACVGVAGACVGVAGFCVGVAGVCVGVSVADVGVCVAVACVGCSDTEDVLSPKVAVVLGLSVVFIALS